MEHPMDFDDWALPATPTKSTKKSNTFDYHPDNSIDDDDEEEDEDDIVDEHDEDGHEGGDELEPHDTDDDLHLQAADSGNASATNSSTGGDQCCYDADASNDSNTADMNLRTRIRHFNNSTARSAESTATTPTATVSPETMRSATMGRGFGEHIERGAKHHAATSSSETEEETANNLMLDNDSRSMPPPPPLAGSNVMGPKSMDLSKPTASSTPTTPAPFIPISEETVFLDPEPPMPSIATSSPHSGDSWMNYSSNSSDDFSGLSEQIKAVTSGRQTGNNSSDEASSDYDSSIISQTEVMLKRYKTQQDAFETAVAAAAVAKAAATPPLTPKILIHKKLNSPTITTTTTVSPTSSTTSSLKSVKGAVKRLRCKDDDDDYDDDEEDHIHHRPPHQPNHHHTQPHNYDKSDCRDTKDLLKKSSSLAKKSSNHKTSLSSSTPVSIMNSPAKTPTTIPATSNVSKTNTTANQTAQNKQSLETYEGIKMDTTNSSCVTTTSTTTPAVTAVSTTTSTKSLNRANTTTTELQQQQHQQQQEIKDITKSKKFLQHASKSLDIDTKIQLCDDMHCLVDVRLIDFAHTAFVPRNGSALFPTPPTTIHHGPDNGFLTGLDSLNRLLTEILSEEVMC